MVVVVVVVVVVNDYEANNREWRWLQSGNRWLRCMADISYGLRSEIPLCCVLEWSIRHLLNPHTLYGQRNCWYGCSHVHCAWHRRRVHPWIGSETSLGAWLRHPDEVPSALLDADYLALFDTDDEPENK